MPYINAVSDWGAVGDGSTDNYANLQAHFDALAPGSRVHFPAGHYMTSRTLSHGADDVWISGDGNATHLSIYSNTYYMPTLAVGLRTVEAGGNPMSNAIRPDMYGVMDATYAPAANFRYGFRTGGNTVARCVAGPGTFGALSAWSITHGTRLFDYWGEATGVTVRLCLFVTPTSVEAMRADGGGATILGLGSVTNPGPWCFGVDASTPCNFCLSFRTADQGVDVGGPFRLFRFPVPTTGGRSVAGGVIHDIEAYVNFTDGSYGARVNNAAVTTIMTSGMTGLAGKRLAKNRGYQFVIGPCQSTEEFNFSWGPVPDFGIYAFNVLRTGTLASANTDASRYGAVANTVLSMDTTGVRLDRQMSLKCGSCVPFDGTAARVFDTGFGAAFVVNNVVSDMKITGGLGFATVNHLKIQRVDANNGVVGLEHYNTGTAYTIDVSDSRFGGYDTAVDMGACIASFRGTNIHGMGDVAMRLRACDLNVDGMFVGGFSDGGRAVFDMISGETNGTYTFNGVQIDTEGYTFTDPDGDGGAVFKIDLHGSSPNTVLDVRGLHHDSAGSAAAVFLLRGVKGNGSGGTLTVRGSQVGPNNGRLVKVTGPDWKADIDRRGLAVSACEGDATSLAAFDFAGEGSGGVSTGFPSVGD